MVVVHQRKEEKVHVNSFLCNCIGWIIALLRSKDHIYIDKFDVKQFLGPISNLNNKKKKYYNVFLREAARIISIFSLVDRRAFKSSSSHIDFLQFSRGLGTKKSLFSPNKYRVLKNQNSFLLFREFLKLLIFLRVIQFKKSIYIFFIVLFEFL